MYILALSVAASDRHDPPAAGRNMVAAEQRRLRGQYEARLAELEAERHGAEADLAQVRARRALPLSLFGSH